MLSTLLYLSFLSLLPPPPPLATRRLCSGTGSRAKVGSTRERMDLARTGGVQIGLTSPASEAAMVGDGRGSARPYSHHPGACLPEMGMRALLR